MIHVYYTCPHCEEEIEVEVHINEEDGLPEDCPSCNKRLPESAHERVNELAVEKASDFEFDTER